MGNRCSKRGRCRMASETTETAEDEMLVRATCNDTAENTPTCVPKSGERLVKFGPMILRRNQPTALLICSHSEVTRVLQAATNEAGWRLILLTHTQVVSSTTPVSARTVHVPHVVLFSFAKAKQDDALKVLRRLEATYPESERPIFIAVTDRRLSCYEERLCNEIGIQKRLGSASNIKDWVNTFRFYESTIVPLRQRIQACAALFTALDHSENPIEITDRDDTVQYVNSAYELVTGCRREEVVGKESMELRRTSLPKGTPGQDDLSRAQNDNSWSCVPVQATPGSGLSSPSGQRVFLKAVASSAPSTSYFTGLKSLNGMVLKPGSAAALANRRGSQTAAIDTPAVELLNEIRDLERQCSDNDDIRQQLQRIQKLLRSSDLYQPVNITKEDKVGTDLLEGLVLNGPLPSVHKMRKASLSEAVKIDESTTTTTSLSQSSKLRKFPQKLYFTFDFEPNRLGINRSAISIAAALKFGSTEVHTILQLEPTWDFNIFELERAKGGERVLSQLAARIFARWNVCNYLQCSDATLKAWLELIESHYHRANPYHNATHAADVLQAVAYYLAQEKISATLDHSEAVAALIAAVIHDVDHPARTSAFLINTKHHLALLYNDVSILENHHAALAFQLTLSNPQANIFASVSRQEYGTLRRNIVDMVLATDMHRHFEYLTKFQQAVLSENNSPVELPSVLESLKQTDDDEHQRMLCRMILKCADVSNPTRPWELCREWAMRIVEEYFCQTEEEQAKGLPLTMEVFDRHKCNLPLTQCRFIDMFVRDMFTDFCRYAHMTNLLTTLETNYARWKEASTSRSKSLELGILRSSPSKRLFPTTGQQQHIQERSIEEEEEEVVVASSGRRSSTD